MMESNQMMEPIDKMPEAGGHEDLGLAGFAQLSILCLPACCWPKYTVSRSNFNFNKSRFDINMFQVVNNIYDQCAYIGGYPTIQCRCAG